MSSLFILSVALRVGTQDENAPNFGFCAAQNFHSFGDKLQAVCTPEGSIKMYELSKA
jgi:hypothetical protein